MAGTFTRNIGQIQNGDVRYYGTFGAVSVGFADSAVLIDIINRVLPTVPEMGPSAGEVRGSLSAGAHAVHQVEAVVRIDFEDANLVMPVGREVTESASNFFLGGDSSKWFSDINSYQEIVYDRLYEGIDLVYRADRAGAKYEFHLAPGADPDDIRMKVSGDATLDLLPSGALSIKTSAGELADSPPLSYQGEQERECVFEVKGPGVYGFRCEGHDPTRPMVIDPLLWATYLGGGTEDIALAIALDSHGNPIVAGWTNSVDFPATTGAYDIVQNGDDWDAFVAKLSADGSSLLWATYLGGGRSDWANTLALDGSGNPIIAGRTYSTDFPTPSGAYDTTFNGFDDAFVAKLSADGSSLLWATYLGGDGEEEGSALTLDDSWNPIVVGMTSSPGFPVTPGAYDTVFDDAGYSDVYIAKLAMDGSSIIWASFLGGDDLERGLAIALDGSDNPIVAGNTESTDFPVTPLAYDATFNGASDAFVAKLSADGRSLLWATYLGGAKYDTALALDIDRHGDAVVVGETASADFPATLGAYDATYNGPNDAFVANLSADGASLLWATFLGGSELDGADALVLDTYGNPIVTGGTLSADFPTIPTIYDATFNGKCDAFVVKLDVNGTSLLWTTFLGGIEGENAPALALDGSGDPVVAGWTNSSDFPATAGAYDVTYDGDANNVFVSKLSAAGAPPSANAGPDFSTWRNQVAELDGSASIDPDGHPLIYLWLQVSGPAILIMNATNAVASILAPSSGIYEFLLNVTDGVSWCTDSVLVTVVNRAPIANAGPDQVVSKGETITLNGNASSDPDGDRLIYSWTAPGRIDLSNASVMMPTFVASKAGTYPFVLTVTDEEGLTAADTMTIVVQAKRASTDMKLPCLILGLVVVILVLACFLGTRCWKKYAAERSRVK